MAGSIPNSINLKQKCEDSGVDESSNNEKIADQCFVSSPIRKTFSLEEELFQPVVNISSISNFNSSKTSHAHAASTPHSNENFSTEDGTTTAPFDKESESKEKTPSNSNLNPSEESDVNNTYTSENSSTLFWIGASLAAVGSFTVYSLAKKSNQATQKKNKSAVSKQVIALKA